MKKRKDGRYCKKIITSDGTLKFFYSTATTERAAERDINHQQLAYENKTEYEKHNFYCLATKMLAEKEKSISYNAYQSYECSLKHLSPFFKMAIEEITPSMFQRIIDDMALKKYAYGTIDKVRVIFSMTVKYAIVREDLNVFNFVPAIKFRQ
mgnify:CR=1 FL=1